MTIEINGKVTTIAQLNGIINSDTDIDGAVSLGGTIIGASLSERGLKGERGAKGDTGETGNGITDIEYVSSLGNVDTYKITFSDGNETTFEVTNGIDGQDGQDGTDGADGFSPIANVTKAGDTATISITDSNGTTTATVSDGADGNDGADGQDGYSPSATVSKVGDTATITITDKGGTTTASISDGDINVQSDWNEADNTKDDYIKNKPTIPSKTSDLNNDSGFITSPNVVYCTCSTAGGTAAKEATIVSGTLSTLSEGCQAIVKFANANSVASPTLKVGTTDAKSIRRYGTSAPSTSTSSSWNADSPILFVYDGTYWRMTGWLNSTYSEISEANITSGTGSSTGLVSGRRAKKAVEAFAPVKSVNGSTGAVTITVPTNVSDLNNDSGFITTETDPIFTASDAYGISSSDISNWNGKSDFSGSYNDLTDKPTIPTVNNATLTIQKNGTLVNTFTANASSNVTANITTHDVPSGGTSGQVLSKNSNNDYDLAWITVSGGGGDVVYATSSDSASTVAKTATIVSGTLTTLTSGVQAIVKFAYTNTASSPTLNIGSTGAKSIKRYGTTAVGQNQNESWVAGSPVLFVYDGTNWVIAGWLNTTYSGGTASGITTGTDNLNYIWSPKQIHDGIAGVAVTTETDPIFTASDAYGIDSTDITNWDNSYNGKVSLDTSAQSGTTDGDLYAAIVALGWENDVIE